MRNVMPPFPVPAGTSYNKHWDALLAACKNGVPPALPSPESPRNALLPELVMAAVTPLF